MSPGNQSACQAGAGPAPALDPHPHRRWTPTRGVPSEAPYSRKIWILSAPLAKLRMGALGSRSSASIALSTAA